MPSPRSKRISMETRVIVSAIIEKNDKLLFGKKPRDTPPYPNTWHLLGGGVNQGEPILDAVKREVLEEAGITLTKIEPISFDEDYELNKHGIKMHYVFLYFKAQYESGELTPKDDIKELKWIEKTELSKIELNKPTIKLFKKLKLL
ncbi:MAG: NUDIX domain-containing protein [Candidatus Micrarchaeota archaeon]